MAAFLLFFFQAVFPVIPYAIIAAAAGAIFGYFYGFLLAYLGALSGAAAMFFLARRLSRERLINHVLGKYDFDLRDLDQRRVFFILLTARIIPVIPTLIINVTAAASGVPFRIFFVSSALGKIIWAAIYAGLGHYLISTGNWQIVLLIVAVLLTSIAIGSFRHRGRLLFRRKAGSGP